MADQNTPDIIYTKVDEAPQLASASFLPVIRAFAAAAGVCRWERGIFRWQAGLLRHFPKI